jgi:hypothetical protein
VWGKAIERLAARVSDVQERLCEIDLKGRSGGAARGNSRIMTCAPLIVFERGWAALSSQWSYNGSKSTGGLERFFFKNGDWANLSKKINTICLDKKDHVAILSA